MPPRGSVAGESTYTAAVVAMGPEPERRGRRRGEMTVATIARLAGGQSYTAANLAELNKDYNDIQNEIGYRIVAGPGGSGWLRLGVLTALIATVLALLINRRLPA